MTTQTNSTFAANSSTILFSNTAPTSTRTFNGGGKTFNTLTVSGILTTTVPPGFTITGANTFANLNFSAPIWVRFPTNVITTITNAFAWTGTGSTNAIMLDGGTSTTVATISSAAANTANWATITGITFTGGGSFTATNSIDMKANTNITITGPSGGGGKIIGG